MAMDLTEARERMVVEQLERRGIKNARVLAAMRAVARDRFIPPEYADHAYDDGSLPNRIIADHLTAIHFYDLFPLTAHMCPRTSRHVL